MNDVETGVLKALFEALTREVLEELRLSKKIKHPGESGRAREIILRRFIEKLLPSAFGVDTGFVIDAKGDISRQIDLVIFRRDYAPVFEVAGVKHFLVESVAVVIENKAAIGSRDLLRQALENVTSVKRLDRTNGGVNQVLSGAQAIRPANPEHFFDQVLTAIMTEESLGGDTWLEEIQTFTKGLPRRLWPNMYVDVNNTFITWLKTAEAGLVMNANVMEATHLGATKKGTEGFVEPLIEFAQEILNFLRVASVIDFSPAAYMHARSGRVDFGPIDWETPAETALE